MAGLRDLTNRRFGKLLAIERAASDAAGHAMWMSQCDCGTRKVIRGDYLISGKVRSCGCIGLKRNAAETLKFDALAKREETARKILANPKTSTATQIERAERFIRLLHRHTAKLEAEVKARHETLLAERNAEAATVNLAEVQELFPILPVQPVGEERDKLLGELQERMAAMQGTEFEQARAYVGNRITDISDGIDQEIEAEQETFAALKETQQELDSRAAEAARVEILDRVRPLLLNPMTLEFRAELKSRCGELAKNARRLMRSSPNSKTSEGANKAPVLTVIAETFEELVTRLKPFSMDLYTSTLDAKYFTSFACSPENWTFRTLDEKAQLRFLTARFYRENGLGHLLPTLPSAPEPIIQGDKPAQSLEFIEFTRQQGEKQKAYLEHLKSSNPQEYLIQTVEASCSLTLEELKEQRMTIRDWAIKQIERLRRKEPKKYEAFRRQRLAPQDFDSEETTVYLVPQSTYENPSAPDAWYWGNGDQVSLSGICRYAPWGHCWVLKSEPLALRPTWGKTTRTWTARDEEIAMARYECQRQGIPFVEPPQSQPVTGGWSEPKRLSFIPGDRQPPVESGRTHFRHGHWFTEAEIDAAQEHMLAVVLPAVDSRNPTIASKPDPDVYTPPFETAWSKHERLQREKQQQQ